MSSSKNNLSNGNGAARTTRPGWWIRPVTVGAG